MQLQTVGEPWMLGVFFIIVILMIFVDMFMLGRKGDSEVSTREALIWSVVWITIAMLFNLWLYFYLGNKYGEEIATQKSLEFLTGYILEKSLAVDNLFVFVMLFAYFKVPTIYQKRVLVYGIFGALILRSIMIVVGATLVSEFQWILYIFGAFLLFSGIKMFKAGEDSGDIENNFIIKFLRKNFKITDNYHGEKFFLKIDGKTWITPLFVVLIFIEVTDLIFAVDSIPAIFAVTTDPFIVYTSNIFAILGLRALYFILADMADRFELLKYGLAVILMFIGVKLLIIEFYKIPILLSLGFVIGVLVISIIASIKKTSKKI
ncbi:MAG: TerC family protein [Campylobacteraceae bacterium]|jgi:tellurite resistance protein TerC|nr:TerC family protein [Campylobacteraceae bacterium]